mmetsp:Transcript_121331/g.241690  ORF Transcript_121331/g.241690 Transcript_121331/m.241690 type:complete len:274 (+) Transcript_121331:999-1820(+)
MMVESFLTVTRRATPKSSCVTLSSFLPSSSVTNVAPVTRAMSCKVAFLLSPNPGAWMAQQSKMPRSLLIMRVANTSFSMVSAMMRSGLDSCLATVRIGISSVCGCEIFWSVTRTIGLDASHCLLVGFDISRQRYGETAPLSTFIPSVNSTSVSVDCDSSREMTPLLPTFAIASAIILPASSSPPAEIAPTCKILSRSSSPTGREIRAISPTTNSVAFTMPFLNCTGLAPPTNCFKPLFTMPWAKIVAVVVPSPATSLVLAAAWRINWTPVFST